MEETQEMIIKLQIQLRDLSMNYWTEHVFNTWQWWFNIAALILPIILWWKLVDKKRLLEIIVLTHIPFYRHTKHRRTI